jgi:hypothetical protein
MRRSAGGGGGGAIPVSSPMICATVVDSSASKSAN